MIMTTTYYDMPDVREVFADGVRMTMFADGVLRAELTVNRPDEPKGDVIESVRTYPAVRLALSPAAMIQLHHQLGQQIETLEKQGTLKRNPAGPVLPQPRH